MIDFYIQSNTLHIGTRKINFQYEILQVKEIGSLLIITLDIPANSNDIDNVYAVNSDCEMIWQIQSREKFQKNYFKVPYVGVSIQGELIKAIDFYGARFLVDPRNGSIVGRDQNGRDW